MDEQLRQLLKRYPLIASKNPDLNLLSEEELTHLRIQQSPLYRKRWSQQKRKLARHSTNTDIKKFIKPADRFRDITRIHPIDDDVNLDSDWPTLEYSVSTEGPKSIALRAECLATMGTRQQTMNLLRLFDDTSNKIAFALSRPCPAFEDRYSTRVELLDCIAWVALKIERAMKMEIKDSKGDWQLSTFRFDLLKPLHLPSWIDQVLLNKIDELVLNFGQDAENAYAWLRDKLKERFHNDAALQGIRAQITRLMALNPGLIEAYCRIKNQTGGRLTLFNTEYSKIWPMAEFWTEVNQKFPGMTVLCHWALKCKPPERLQNVNELRSVCLKHGLSPRGWRYLLKHGEASYLSVIDSGINESNAFPVSVRMIEWQCRAGLNRALPKDLAIAFVNFAALNMRGDPNLANIVDPRVARVATERYASLPTSRERSEFAQNEWLEMLIWLKNLRPAIDKNQWKSGWLAIWRLYESWLDTRDHEAEWVSRIKSIHHRGMRIKPLTCSRDLCREGIMMRNCVATYAKECKANKYRVFSIRSVKTQKRIATLGLILKKGIWKLDQVKGKNNRRVSEEIQNQAKSLADLYQQAESRFIARRQNRFNEPTNRGAIRAIDSRHLKLASNGVLMERNEFGEWFPAEASDLPISAALKSVFVEIASGEPESTQHPGTMELTVRLRLELPASYSVYVWDKTQECDRLMTLD